MEPRDRVLAALEFRSPDVVPVEYHPSPAGMSEHGEALRELMVACGHDFGDAAQLRLAHPDPTHIDSNGRYRALRRDPWGALWEHLIFGVGGHPVERPLDSWDALGAWRPPAARSIDDPGFAADRERATAHRERFFLKDGWISIFEVLHAVRRFEDVLMDIASDDPRIGCLADAIVEVRLADIRYALARGTDAIQFADDFGTQQGLMLSAKAWGRFFRPRYERLIEPVKAAGVKAFFHTCGMAEELLEPIAAIGFDAIWPQASLYDVRGLAARCRSLGMAVAIHPDRSHLMTFGSPGEIREELARLADAFDVGTGGAWFYVEIDNGFPFDNVCALIEGIQSMRGTD